MKESPYSSAADSFRLPGRDGGTAGGPGLPGFVPARFRAPILRSASRWDVSAGLLAAQLLAESNFNLARILGLMGGAGELVTSALEVRLTS